MIIDAWMQHPTEKHFNHEAFDSLKRWMRKTGIEQLPVEMTMAMMDQGGVNKMMAAAWSSLDGWLITNDDIKALMDAYPDRIIGVAGADLNKPMEGVRELRRRVKDDGFKALRMVPWMWKLPPTDRRYYPLYAECVELGIPFCTQVGHTGPLRPSETGRPIPYIDEIALDFPELTIVCGHIGYPWTQEMIAVATKHENVYIDTSAYTVKRYPSELVQYMKGHGQKKVLFGTNYPMIMPAKALEGLDDLSLSDEAKEDFLWRNADRVFKLGLAED